jgi:hypothetical protein
MHLIQSSLQLGEFSDGVWANGANLQADDGADHR